MCVNNFCSPGNTIQIVKFFKKPVNGLLFDAVLRVIYCSNFFSVSCCCAVVKRQIYVL